MGEVMKVGTASNTGKYGWVLGLMFILAGCQSTAPVATSGSLDNTSFMNLWTTYRHCETGVDVDAMVVDAHRLNSIAQQSGPATKEEAPLPKMITRWVSEPANRLAVDPKAMAVSCSLRTGQSALQAGRNDLASEMFQAVLTYPEGAYPYHATQAREGLAQLNGEANLSSMLAPNPAFTTALASTSHGK
jgi:hypothetical protein